MTTRKLFDPTFTYQRYPPTSYGDVISASGDEAEVSFRGRTISAKIAGASTLSTGDQVSVVWTGNRYWCIAATGEYPSLWLDLLENWRGKANLFLRYIIRNNPPRHLYKHGIAGAAVSESVLSVTCWDGVVRELQVEYNDEGRQASAFTAGDPVLLYNKNPLMIPEWWVVVGKDAEGIITLTPSAVNLGNVTVGYISSVQEIVVTSEDVINDITLAVSGEGFSIAPTISGPFGASVVLPSAGGSVYVRYEASTPEGAKVGAILASSPGATSATATLTANARTWDGYNFFNIVRTDSQFCNRVVYQYPTGSEIVEFRNLDRDERGYLACPTRNGIAFGGVIGLSTYTVITVSPGLYQIGIAATAFNTTSTRQDGIEYNPGVPVSVSLISNASSEYDDYPGQQDYCGVEYYPGANLGGELISLSCEVSGDVNHVWTDGLVPASLPVGYSVPVTGGGSVLSATCTKNVAAMTGINCFCQLRITGRTGKL